MVRQSQMQHGKGVARLLGMRQMDSCKGNMLDKPRIRAFSEYIREFGEERLRDRLCENEKNGLRYHYDGQFVGDYDKCESKDEIFALIDGKRPR